MLFVLGGPWLACGLLLGLHLLLDRTRLGVVVSSSSGGGPTDYPGVIWGGGVLLVPQAGDWDRIPKVGDQVSVLPWPGAGTLNTIRAIRRTWKKAVGDTLIGVVLLAGSYVLLKRDHGGCVGPCGWTGSHFYEDPYE